ncbi:MAG: MFS transporter [Alphaproteobacteria bacterium]
MADVATLPVPARFPMLPALVLAMAGFLTQLDVTAVIVVLPGMAEALGFGVAGHAWTMDAYSLAFTGTLLAAGAVADRHGRRRVMLGGNLLFAAASLACGLAWDGPSLWAARAVQGVAAAFVVTGGIALIAATYPEAGSRARAFALVGTVSGVAMAAGPTLGGLAGAHLGWRWVFLANLPACALVAWGVPRLVAERRAAAAAPLDPLGIGLLTAALALAVESLLATDRSTIAIVGGFALAVALAVAFARRERRRPFPTLDPAIFAAPAVLAVGLLLAAMSVAYWAILVYLPVFMAAGIGWPAEAAGPALVVATLPMLVLSPFGGRAVLRLGWRRLFALGLGLVAAGDLALAAAALFPPIAVGALFCGMACIGTGAALANPQLSGAMVALVPADRAGMASAVTVVMRQGAFAVGVAGLGTVLARQVGSGFPLLFALAAAVATLGVGTAIVLLPTAAGRASGDS